MNGAFLGVYTHTFHSSGLAWEWWAWLLPTVSTELLAIVLLSGGGLFIGHQIVSPGRKSRADALREARGHIIRLLLFAFPMLLLAALIEAFVRQFGAFGRKPIRFRLGYVPRMERLPRLGANPLTGKDAI